MSIELVAVEDSWVNDFPDNRDANLNRMGLGIGRWTALNRSFIKFNLRGLPVAKEDVVAAEIRLYGRALFTPLVVEAHYTHMAWSEATVTWNNQPSPTTYHWDDKTTSLMGKTTNVPTTEGWFSIPIDIAFIRLRWERYLSAILKGYEDPDDSYCYAEDREAKKGVYAPRLVLYMEAPVGVPTNLTIKAPSNVAVGTPFTVTGKLTFREGGVDYPLQGRTISLSYNGVSLGKTTTGADGTYNVTVSIPEPGTYTLEASYAGEAGLSPTQATSILRAVPISLIPALIPLAIGTVLMFATRTS